MTYNIKKFLIFIALIAISEPVFCQQIDFPLLEKLTKISFDKIDDFMVNHYGFEIIPNKTDAHKRTYGKIVDNTFTSTIVISVNFSDEASNKLEVLLSENFDLKDIKNNLLNRGYEKGSLYDFKYQKFQKGESTVLVSSLPNANGKSEIILLED